VRFVVLSDLGEEVGAVFDQRQQLFLEGIRPPSNRIVSVAVDPSKIMPEE
jgi:hypothetical protein